MSQQSNVGRVPHGLLTIFSRGGTLSDASSVPGRVSGNDFEQLVRKRLTGSHDKQADAKFTAQLDCQHRATLDTLWKAAMTISEKSTGTLWRKIKPDDNKARQAAEPDIISVAESNLKNCLGAKLRFYSDQSLLAFGNSLTFLFLQAVFSSADFLTLWTSQGLCRQAPLWR